MEIDYLVQSNFWLKLFLQNIWLNNRWCRKCVSKCRSSRPEVFCEKGVLENFTKFIWKHLCQGLFSNKVADLSPATLLKMRLWHRCFPVNFVRFLRTPFFTENLWWLLLKNKQRKGFSSDYLWNINFCCVQHATKPNLIAAFYCMLQVSKFTVSK